MPAANEEGSNQDALDSRNPEMDQLIIAEKLPSEAESSGSSPANDKEALKVSSDDVERFEGKDTMKAIKDELSSALLMLREKEDLAKQHAKVAEEAVSGWEKAEKEVVSMKQQLESALQMNSSLEDKIAHLDSALKECVRELRQSREEQEQKTRVWESEKNVLKNQIFDLETLIEAEREASTSLSSEIQVKLDAMEKENEYLKAELLSQSEELNIRTLERELSTQAAEIASKQHLESIKRITKLESECLQLRAMACKKPSSVDRKQIASPLSVDSFTDSQSDDATYSVEQFKGHEIDLMDDFVQMEKLAAMAPAVDLPKISEVEEKIQKLETEKAYVEALLSETQDQFEKANSELVELQRDLMLTKDLLQVAETEMESEVRERKSLESQLQVSKSNAKEMREKIEELERKLKEEKASYQNLKDELAWRNQEAEAARTALLNGELKMKQDKELAVAAGKLAECQKTIASLGQQLRSLANLDDMAVEFKGMDLNEGFLETRVLDTPSFHHPH